MQKFKIQDYEILEEEGYSSSSEIVDEDAMSITESSDDDASYLHPKKGY